MTTGRGLLVPELSPGALAASRRAGSHSLFRRRDDGQEEP
jgi:hypothetical protein